MGDRLDRFGGDRRPREQDDRDNGGDRPRRNFGDFAKDKDGEDGERPRRNGLNRNRTDPPWARDNNNEPQPSRERFDRAKSWRDRAPVDDQLGDTHTEKPRERNYERRWDRDRDQRQEREPEWFDEPVEEKTQKHTEEDFKKFMEEMKGGRKAAAAEPTPAPAIAPSAREDRFEPEKTKPSPAPAIELGTDKFFAAFAQATIDTPGNTPEAAKESAVPTPAAKPKTGSRFQTFFSSQQEESRRQPELSVPAAVPTPATATTNPLLALVGAASPQAPAHNQDSADKVAFQALIQKLQKQSLQATTPPSAGFSEPPPNHDMGRKSTGASPSPFMPYGQERREDPLARPPLPPQGQEMHGLRPQPNAQVPPMRPEQQMLNELLGQRHTGPSQGPPRAEQPPSRNNNSNAEFFLNLMQSSRGTQDLPRNDQPVMRMPQPSRPAQVPPTPDRELDFQRERNVPQHPAGRPTGLPSFFDEPQLHHREQDNRPQQPTQILQRQQGPPGLEQMHPNWIQAGGPQGPPPGRHMIPPPGLATNPRNAPPPGIFPPNFPMGAFPPEGMAGPPRNMPPPPGFFGGLGGPPPPGGPPGGPPSGPPGAFMPPPGMGFQSPEALGFGFDSRNLPPGAGGPFRRN